MAKFHTTTCLLLLLATVTTARSKTTSATSWTPPSPAKVAKLLGWIPYPDNKHICRGYYQQLAIAMPSNDMTNMTTWKADRAILWQQKPSYAYGHVVINQTGRQITGDTLIMYRNKSTNRLATCDIYGNVHLQQPGMLAVGSKARVNIQKKTATLNHATFRYHMTPPNKKIAYDEKHHLRTVQIQGKNLRGNAVQIHQVNPKLITLRDVSITTCDPFSDAWRLKARSLRLDQITGMGTARNATLLIHGVPIFYTPYLLLPIDNRRRSGFLAPSFSNSSQSGFTFYLPYYWNIAPNYDMTITPNYYSKRGLGTSSWFRYLNHHGNGQIYFSLIPGDKRFAGFKNDVAKGTKYPGTGANHESQKNTLASDSANRYRLGWLDNIQYNPYLSTKIDINYVSDDYYLQDFGNRFTDSSHNDAYGNLVQTTQLTQLANLLLTLPHWAISIETENFQTLHPITLGTNIPQDQYARLPQININGSYPDALWGLNYNLGIEFTNFQHPLLEGNFPTTLPTVTGMRYNVAPSIGANFSRPWGYLKPNITLESTIYHLSNPVASLQQQRSLQRHLPIYNIDAGLYFDRSIHLGNTPYTQTLEPRLFYLSVPYVEQNNLPLFDTQVNSSLTYAQLFNTNRFQGLDRFGDANQFTIGVTSRFIKNSNGNDIFHVSLGQIYYLRHRQVQANQSNPPAALSETDTAKVSPLVGTMQWQFLDHWSATGNIAYENINHHVKKGNLGIKYQIDNQHILNTSYWFVRGENGADDLRQVNLGISWPLGARWQTLGGIHYDISQHYTPNYLYGMQYKSCCWAVRLLAGRRYLGFKSDGKTRQYDQSIYLQFSLTGLMSIGNQDSNSTDHFLKYTIPGYQDNFGREHFF